MRRTTFIIIGLAVLLVAVLATVAFVELRLPNNHQGYQPVQPVAFSHRLHAGTLGAQCQYCHYGADESRHAAIPSPSTCMNCHTLVKGRTEFAKAEIAKVEQAALSGKPINWVRVHNLPDFAYFNHSAHVSKDVACQTCHGRVEDMATVRQESDLSMGWCVNCHREQNAINEKRKAPLDCAACHR